MVLQTISKEEAPLKQSMATAPVKSQPLHNFSFPFLKWGKNQTNNHRHRKSGDSVRESSPLDHRSSTSDAESDGGSRRKEECDSGNKMNPIGSRSGRSRSSFPSSSSSSPPLMAKPQKNTMMFEEDASGAEDVRRKLLIRIRTANKEESVPKNKPIVASNEGGGGELEESVPKPWNLRPRRAVFKGSNHIGRGFKDGELQENHSTPLLSENLPKSLRLRGFIEAQNVEKKEKQNFSIPLTREEIEEDFFAMTGSKPSRRPKKRAKNVQKQLENAFPGLWLAEITPDSYRVPDSPQKR